MDCFHGSLLTLMIVLFAFCLGIGVPSLVVYNITPNELNTNSSNTNNNTTKLVECYHDTRTFVLASGITAIIVSALIAGFAVIFVYLTKHNSCSGDGWQTAIIPGLISAFFFGMVMGYGGAYIFNAECLDNTSKYHMLWVIGCVTFSISTFVVGISILTCIGFMCNGWFNAEDD